MRTLDISPLRQERERLLKRIQQMDVLLDAVAAFDGSRPKKADARRVLAEYLPQAGREYSKLKKARWAKVRAAKKAKG